MVQMGNYFAFFSLSPLQRHCKDRDSACLKLLCQALECLCDNYLYQYCSSKFSSLNPTNHGYEAGVYQNEVTRLPKLNGIMDD
jgi:hypothetical protein